MPPRKRPTTRPLRVELVADSVLPPIVHYGAPFAFVLFRTADERKGRVLFEKLDSISVCRGEYPPYETTEAPGSWVSVIEDSPLLRQRYEYEAHHYRGAYEFCGDVDEMLRDFRHYLFSFHDEFIEAIARGIWLDIPTDSEVIPEGHPFVPLPQSSRVAHIHEHDLVCEVRGTRLEREQVIKNSEFCSQPLLDFVLELDGRSNLAWTLSLRQRGNQPISLLRSALGRIEAEFEGVACIEDIRPFVERGMREVRDRRRAMGK